MARRLATHCGWPVSSDWGVLERPIFGVRDPSGDCGLALIIVYSIFATQQLRARGCARRTATTDTVTLIQRSCSAHKADDTFLGRRYKYYLPKLERRVLTAIP